MLQCIKNIIFQKILKPKSSAASDATEAWQKYQRFTHQNWITIITTFLSTGLCLFILYISVSPLRELPVSNFGDGQPVKSGTIRAGTISPMAAYLELLKARDLFKPSVPIPAEKKIGKTTAEQLAQRLLYLGTSGDGQNLLALVFIPERGPGLFKAGDRVAEFVLKEIRKDSLVLELESEQIILRR